ncbi:MAG: response regulator [Candidatus Colwellbacteria bacterium]|nr:response regulator [Candidatus Colwellbacteria bacterium]
MQRIVQDVFGQYGVSVRVCFKFSKKPVYTLPSKACREISETYRLLEEFRRMTSIDILVVDDEPHIRRTLSYLLTKSGYTVETAQDGVEAIEKAQMLTPKLMFLDIMMPKKDGYEVCQLLKSDESLRSIYIILLTAKGQSIDSDYGLKQGANEFLTKPYSPLDILSRAKQICQH